MKFSSFFIYTLGIIFLLSSCEKRLTKDYHTGTFSIELPDTNISFNNHVVLNITYDQLGEGTYFHIYGEQYDTLNFYQFEAHFWNSGVYQAGYEYLEGELNTGNYCDGYIDAPDSTAGTYNFNGANLAFEQVDENRVKGVFYGNFDHWSYQVPVTGHFDFTP